MATNYTKNILEKVFDLLSVEFKGHEVKIYKSDDPVNNGYFIDSISLKVMEKQLLSRQRTISNYIYPFDLILRRKIIKDEKVDDFLGEYESRIRERLVERNQAVSGIWNDNIVESIDLPEDEIIDIDDEQSEIIRKLVIHWNAYVYYEPTLS